MTPPRRTLVPPALRRAFGAVQAASPALAARLFERLFFTPPRSPLAADAREFLRTGRPFALTVSRRPVVGWRWGAGPVVYLVHGWGGRGGRLGAFARPLIEAGYAVVTFDAPGHGASGWGLSSMPEFARALLAVVARHGRPHGVIAHSLGGAAATLAASWGVSADRFALLAPAADPAAFAQVFATELGAATEVVAQVKSRSERRLQFSWDDLDVCALAARMTAPALVVHDRADDTVPFSEGAAIAASWPGARLVETDGLGHRGVVRDPAVVTEVVEFIAGASLGAAGALPRGETASLEHELFYRETRWR